MEGNLALGVPYAFFIMLACIVFVVSKYSYQTKKAIVENGGTLDQHPRKKAPFLEIGFIVLGVGLGLVLSVLPQSMDIPDEAKDSLVGACVLVCGGAGMISAFFIRRKLDADK